MKKETRLVVEKYNARIAELNGTSSVAQTFSVDPSVQQKLEKKMQESSDFLSKINLVGVTEMEGEKLGLGIGGPSASRTNTDNADRKTRDISTLDQVGYRCEKTNSDTHVKYSLLDAWAKFPEFQSMLAGLILERQALDRIMIGFNGVKVAADTNIEQYPLLQDLNKGWLQVMREQAPQRVMGRVAAGQPGKIIIGEGSDADYANLDAAVFDAKNLLDPWYRQDTGLVAIVGDALLGDKYFPLVNKTQAPTEVLAADIIISQKRLGGLQAVQVPFFPAHAILITRLDNLSIYYQEGARRRRMVDNAARDRIENYESSNDAYVIERLGQAALLENIQYKAGA